MICCTSVALFLAIDVGTNGDVGQAIAVPDHAFFEAVFQGRDLRQRANARCRSGR